MALEEPVELAALRAVLKDCGRLTIAVSGGVDSTTLTAVTYQTLGADAGMVHAVSPAVPQAATERLRARAVRDGWPLEVLEAGEFSDPRYLANPVNRCFFCKTNLYDRISGHVDEGVVIASGTNTDDLGDFRPGLEAARNHQIRHPFVEAGIDKQAVRRIARYLGLDEVAELPASPCLSSRVETGIPINAEHLVFINRAESLIRDRLGVAVVRCRIRHAGVALEMGADDLARLSGGLLDELSALAVENGFPAALVCEPYRQGSAFLRAGN